MTVQDANRWFSTDPDAPLNLDERHGSAVVIIDAFGRVLLQQRDDMTPPEGFGRWAIPGGGAEPGETARVAAFREIEEETGIILQEAAYFASIDVFRPNERPSAPELIIHLFYARNDVREADIIVGEGIGFRFWTPAEVATLAMNPNGRHWLERFLASEAYLSAANVAVNTATDSAAGA